LFFVVWCTAPTPQSSAKGTKGHAPRRAQPSRLFLSQKANAAREGATFVIAKGEKVRSIDVVVYVCEVTVPSYVVEASPNGPIIAERVEAFFDVGIERKPGRKAAGAWRFD
jgi:hypothetical protein